jgi:hypothetical protein
MTQRIDLLRHVLAEQIDDGAGDTLTENRILEVLNGRDTFTAVEQRLLWTAPVARRRYLHLRREAAARAAAAMKQGGAELVGRRMAAAAADNVHVLEIGDSTLHIVRDPDPKLLWILSLRLGERFLQNLPAGLSVRLADTGGRTWLLGRPDSSGEIHGSWGDATASPFQRLLEHQLVLGPV